MKTHGTFRYRLLTGVAAVALLIAVEGTPARADDTTNWWLTFQGQFPIWDENGDSSRRDGLSLDEGFGISGEFGWKLDDIHSIVARVKINKRSDSQSNSSRYYSSFVSGYLTSNGSQRGENTTFTADLEVGRDVGLGTLGLGEGDLRAFAGIRIAHLTATDSSVFVTSASGSPYSSFNDTTRRTFTGAGPRVGFAASKPLSEQVSFDFGAAGGVLIGRQRETFEGSYSNFGSNSGPLSSSDSSTAVVPNVEASAALKFLFNEDTTFSAGYKVDAFFNAIDAGEGGDDDRILHGPFVQFTIKN